MKEKTLTNSYLSVLSMELSMLIQAGIPVSDSVLMLQDDERDKNGKLVLQSILTPLDDGGTLSDALKASGYFPNHMINMVRIGEKTGRMGETLKALSEHYDRQDRLLQTIKNAVLYPTMLLIMMLAVVVILIVRVLPIFNEVFSQLGTQMSPLASNLMRFGGWLRNASAIIALVFGMILAVLLIVWIVPEIREGVVKALKNKWGDKGVFGRIASSRFLSAMALSVASGLGIEESVSMASSISGGVKGLDKKYDDCMDMLHKGKTMAESMYASGILSARNSRMLSIGARSGATDEAMLEIARRSEYETQGEINRMVGRIEPILVIVTSVIVGVILLSVMLPLISIMSSIG